MSLLGVTGWPGIRRRRLERTVQEMLAWLMGPFSGAARHTLDQGIAWHGRLMVLAWVVLVPTAVLLARFFKIAPRQQWPRQLDNRFWWHGHRLLNYGAAALSLIAVVWVWRTTAGSGNARVLHAWLGWGVLACGALQLLSAHLRGSKGGPTDPRRHADGRVHDWRGDHYDMSARRVAFEWVHKCIGYLSLLLAMGTALLGLNLADAPRWMWLALAAWCCAWIVLFSRLQARGRCIDTYQAIWGPDPMHPGNRVHPIGWGIRRSQIPIATRPTPNQMSGSDLEP